MTEVSELLAANTVRRIALAEKLHTNKVDLYGYQRSIIALADREGKQIAELLGKLGK
jgi:hypothetical protein|tara:strand:+ start:4968 stop:5138 length:171 start_codon:yes stop_codon:yes gene_type:complete